MKEKNKVELLIHFMGKKAWRAKNIVSLAND